METQLETVHRATEVQNTHNKPGSTDNVRYLREAERPTHEQSEPPREPPLATASSSLI